MRLSVLSLVGLTYAAPQLIPRQENYGSWDVTYTSEGGGGGWSYRYFDAVYTNSKLADPITVNCKWTSYRDSETKSCTDPTFRWSVGGPWGKNTLWKLHEETHD